MNPKRGQRLEVFFPLKRGLLKLNQHDRLFKNRRVGNIPKRSLPIPTLKRKLSKLSS